MLRRIWSIIWKKKLSSSPVDILPRCLTVVDIACLGLATTLGTGAYVLMPEAAKGYAGPSVVISIIVASVTSCLGSLCYSEVSTRFPSGGSAYVYAYATTGEFFAFLIGWGMVLEYSLGTALASKACTQYIDVTLNGTLSSAFQHLIGKLDIPGLDRYVDIPSVITVIFASSLLMFSMKFLCTINNFLVILNLLVLSGIIFIATFNMDVENWMAGAGFFPNGASGVFAGASITYFSFVGYDIMSVACGQTKHSSKVLPMATTLVFLIGLLTLFGTSAAVTLFIPAVLLQSRGSLLEALILRGVIGIQYFAVVGAVAGFMSAAVASLFALTRLLQSLATDGLLFKFLVGKKHGLTTMSCPALITSCTASSILALALDKDLLVHCLGMGTLLSSMAVAISVMCLRYGMEENFPFTDTNSIQECSNEQISMNHTSSTEVQSGCKTSISGSEGNIMNDYGSIHCRSLSVDYVNDSYVTTCLSDFSPHWTGRTPNRKSAATAAGLIVASVIIMLMMGVVTLHIPKLLPKSTLWTEVVACGLFLIVILCVAMICRQPRHRPRHRNHVPCVPLLPVSAILMDVHLLVGLSYSAWLLFLVWSLFGSLLYLVYGLWNSTLRKQGEPDVGLLSLNDDQDDFQDEDDGLADSI